MKKGWLLFMGLWAWVAVQPVIADPIIPRSLAQLEQTPPASPDAFDFVVCGDTHSNKQLVYQTDVFKTMIREWNTLQPALVLEVGDLVLGGAAEGVPQQWDLFQTVIAECRVPYFSAPGNHDISDTLTERLWTERMGPTHYAFSYGNSRFIVLDSEEVDALDAISEAQFAWLKQELEGSQAKNIFIFLHQPYFTDYEDPEKMDETWARRWKPMADLFHGHPVRVVFAGHEHSYRDFGVRDGVRYVICAGGASFGKGREKEGLFNHYLLVRVRGEQVNWSVIQPGQVFPSDIVTNDRITELFRIRHRLVQCDEVPVPYGESLDRDITVQISNPYSKPFSASATWEIPEGWKVNPVSQEYAVVENEKVQLSFHVSAVTSDAVRFPVPVLKTRYGNSASGEPVDVALALPLIPVMRAPHTAAPIQLDGHLDEWSSTPPVTLPYVSGFETGKYDPADLSGTCRALWDEQNLYLAFDVTDNDHCQPYAGDIVWLADAIEFGVDRWAWGVSLTKAGPEVFLYIGEGQSAEMVNKEVSLAVRRDAGHTIYEVAIPSRLCAPLVFAPGQHFQWRIQVADRDTSDARHEMLLTLGGGSAAGARVELTK